MIESDNEFNDSPNHGTPYANLDSDARSIMSELDVNKNQIGHGSFGRVYKSIYKTKEGNIIDVAVKKINIRNSEGFPLSAIREITILKKYNHPNIVKYIDTFVDKPVKNIRGNVSLVYEYAQHDLASLIKEKIDFDLDCIKSIMFQILNGVKFIHDNYILHRDIKPANILITNKGEVKLADFGLSRFYEKRKNQWKAYTNSVETLWYRAPELLLRECYYKTSIDMWSVGCVMAELFIKEALFKEQNPIDQIKQIIKVIGRPSDEDLSRYYRINEGEAPYFIESILPEKGEYSDFEGTLESLDRTGFLKKKSQAMDLIKGMLTFNVNKRLTAEQALKHEFFNGLNFEKAVIPLFKKLQGEIFKNKEFHGEKVIYVKKKDGLIKDKENNTQIYGHCYCSEPPERKGHIMKKMDGYDIEEDKMEVEQPNKNEQDQNWNDLEDFI
jgi:cell division cycle 2-like protein